MVIFLAYLVQYMAISALTVLVPVFVRFCPLPASGLSLFLLLQESVYILYSVHARFAGLEIRSFAHHSFAHSLISLKSNERL